MSGYDRLASVDGGRSTGCICDWFMRTAADISGLCSEFLVERLDAFESWTIGSGAGDYWTVRTSKISNSWSERMEVRLAQNSSGKNIGLTESQGRDKSGKRILLEDEWCWIIRGEHLKQFGAKPVHQEKLANFWLTDEIGIGPAKVE